MLFEGFIVGYWFFGCFLWCGRKRVRVGFGGREEGMKRYRYGFYLCISFLNTCCEDFMLRWVEDS